MENEKNNNFLYDDDSDNDRQVYTSESEVNEGDDEDNSEYDAENAVSTNFTPGSTCLVLEDSSVWMLGNDKKWHEI